MRKMSHEKRREKLARLNSLKLEYLSKAVRDLAYWSPAVDTAGRIAGITDDYAEWLALWELADDAYRLHTTKT